jgi:hypothetical protein
MCVYIQGVSGDSVSSSFRLVYIAVKNLPVHETESLRRLWRERMCFSCRSTHFTYLKLSIIRALLSFVFEPITKPSHTEENMLCKVLGNLRTILWKTVLEMLA